MEVFVFKPKPRFKVFEFTAPEIADTAAMILNEFLSDGASFRTEEDEDRLCQTAARVALKLHRAVVREFDNQLPEN